MAQRAANPTSPQSQVPHSWKLHTQVALERVTPSTEPPVPVHLDKPTVRLRVQRERDKIKRCYDDRLAVDPTLEGVVTTHFAILPSGSVGSSNVRGLDSEIERCITNILQRLEFPRSRNGVSVTYPFHFVVKDAPGRSMSW